jgi:hypothetical protein
MLAVFDSGVHRVSPNSAHALAAETWDLGVRRIRLESAEELCEPVNLMS